MTPHTPRSTQAPFEQAPAHPFPHGSAAPHAPGPGLGPGPRTNTLSVVALVAAFVAPIVGLVLGVVARKQVRRTGENGRGLATTGIVLSALFSAVWVLGLVLVLTFGTVSSSFQLGPSVPSSSVESTIAQKAGLPAGTVSCPQDLPAQVGASTECTATVDGTPTTVVATVTSVNGDDVEFDFTSR